MRRQWGSIFALLLIAAGPATQPSDRPANPATAPAELPIKLVEFTSDPYRFRLHYPADWTVLDHPVSGQVFSLQTQPTDHADANLGVIGLRIDTGPEGTADAQTLKDISDSIADYLFNHGGKKIAIKAGSLGVMNARQVQVTTTAAAGDTQAMYVIAVHNRIEYVFTIAAPASEFVKMLPKMNALLSSFEVLD